MWLADNIIAVAAIFLGLCVLIGLVALGLTGLRLWFAFRRSRSQMSEPLERLTAALETTERLQGAMPAKREQLEGALTELEVQARAVRMLATHASEALAVLRSPLTYIGR